MSFKFHQLNHHGKETICISPHLGCTIAEASRRPFDSTHPQANICTNSTSFKFHELIHKETNFKLYSPTSAAPSEVRSF